MRWSELKPGDWVSTGSTPRFKVAYFVLAIEPMGPRTRIWWFDDRNCIVDEFVDVDKIIPDYVKFLGRSW